MRDATRFFGYANFSFGAGLDTSNRPVSLTVVISRPDTKRGRSITRLSRCNRENRALATLAVLVKRIIALLAGIIAIIAIVAGSYLLRVNHRLQAIQPPLVRKFVDLSEPWKFGPLDSGGYWILVSYVRAEKGRLDEPLKVKLSDLTTMTDIRLDCDWVGGRTGTNKTEDVIVGCFDAKAGHQYEIEVDGKQAAALAGFGHSIEITLNGAEVENRMFKAYFE